VKVGKTTNLEQRLRSLDNTSVTLPFRCVFAVEVDDENEVERFLHQAFADNRTRTTREFFEVDAQRVIAAMQLTRGNDGFDRRETNNVSIRDTAPYADLLQQAKRLRCAPCTGFRRF
jgi:hypothetical protein